MIVWCRTDLRTDDNPALQRALTLLAGGEFGAVLPVYFLDPRQFGRTPFGSWKTGPFRAKFVLECIRDFKARLRALGSDLLVVRGQPEARMGELVRAVGATEVVTEQQIADEERRVDARVRTVLASLGAELVEIWGNTLYHLNDLRFANYLRDMPDVFTPFRERCESSTEVREPAPPPKEGSLPLPKVDLPGLSLVPDWADLPFPEPVPEPADMAERSAFLIPGGETAALARLRHYLWDTDTVAKYFDVRNGMLGTEYSTKLSASLAQGCISARRIRQEVVSYERQRTKNKSTYWVVFELIWRDYFRFFAAKHGNRIFKLGGTAGLTKPWTADADALQRWKEGRTGWPLVDANMRELRETGWMSNRGRQNVASFLALDLGIDWRLGADHFESLLVDYDVTSNWGNWVAAAGLTGGRVNKFNITKQAHDYDHSGEYVRAWLPELQGLRGTETHEPWLLPAKEREALEAAGYPLRRLQGSAGGTGGAQGRGERQPRRNNRLRQSDAKASRTQRRACA